MSVTSAIASGVANTANSYEERTARVNTAKLQQQQAELSLQEYRGNAGVRQSEAELRLAETEAAVQQLRSEQLKNNTFKTFDTYSVDKDAKHLNTFLKTAKSNPQGASMWGQWARFDNLADTPEVRAQLSRAGLAPDDILNTPDMAAKYVLGTNTEGAQQLLDLDKLYQVTGYTRFMNSRELESMTARAQLEKMLSGEQSADSRLIRDIQNEAAQSGAPIDLLEATKQYYATRNGQRNSSTVERVANDLMATSPGMSRADALKQASRTVASPSAAEKDIGLTAQVRQNLHDLSESGSFYDLDLTEPSTRARAGELITDLEKASGKRLANETKVTARNLRSLTALGGTAGEELSGEETGVLDNMLYKVQKYFSDDIGGVEGASNYETFRNIFRNALYGASLTGSEISAFEQAAGNLKQKLGPVLGQLRTQLSDVKTQLESVSQFEDPMMSYYYFGRSQDDILEVITQIDRRLEYFDSYSKKVTGGKDLTVKEARKINTPRVMPTEPGTTPAVSAAERWKQLKGGTE